MSKTNINEEVKIEKDTYEIKKSKGKYKPQEIKIEKDTYRIQQEEVAKEEMISVIIGNQEILLPRNAIEQLTKNALVKRELSEIQNEVLQNILNSTEDSVATDNDSSALAISNTISSDAPAIFAQPNAAPNQLVNGFNNLVTNMNSGSASATLHSAAGDFATAGQNLSTAAAGAATAATNAPSVFGQFNTAWSISNWAHYIARHGWWIKNMISSNSGTIVKVTIGGINVVTSVVALHPQFVLLTALGVIVYLNQDPLSKAVGGARDLVVDGLKGVFNAATGAAKAAVLPALIVENVLKNFISPQHAVKSDGKHITVNFFDIKLLTEQELIEITNNKDKIIAEFIPIAKNEIAKNETEVVEMETNTPTATEKGSLVTENGATAEAEETSTTEIALVTENAPVEDIREGWVAINTGLTDSLDFTTINEQGKSKRYNAQGEEIVQDEDGFVITPESNENTNTNQAETVEQPTIVENANTNQVETVSTELNNLGQGKESEYDSLLLEENTSTVEQPTGTNSNNTEEGDGSKTEESDGENDFVIIPESNKDIDNNQVKTVEQTINTDIGNAYQITVVENYFVSLLNIINSKNSTINVSEDINYAMTGETNSAIEKPVE